MYQDEEGFIRVSKRQEAASRKSSDAKRKVSLSPTPSSSCKFSKYCTIKESTSESASDSEPSVQMNDQQLKNMAKSIEMRAAKFIKSTYFRSFNSLFNQVMGKQPNKDQTKDLNQEPSISEKKKKVSKLPKTPTYQLNFDQVICYGLGNFQKENSCKKQLYFLLCLRKKIKCKRWEIYDPVFSLNEIGILKQLNFLVTECNEHCRRSINEMTGPKRTLFYMPHCHKFMFNNLFWANWSVEAFSVMHLIGNSLDFITDECVQKNDTTDFTYLHNLMKLGIVSEIKIPDTNPNKHIFNDLSIHTFDTSHLTQADFDRYYVDLPPSYLLQGCDCSD